MTEPAWSASGPGCSACDQGQSGETVKSNPGSLTVSPGLSGVEDPAQVGEGRREADGGGKTSRSRPTPPWGVKGCGAGEFL